MLLVKLPYFAVVFLLVLWHDTFYFFDQANKVFACATVPLYLF